MIPLRRKIHLRWRLKRWIGETADPNSKDAGQRFPASENRCAAGRTERRVCPSPRTRDPPPVAILAFDCNDGRLRKKRRITESAPRVSLTCRAAAGVDVQRCSTEPHCQAPAYASGSSGNHFLITFKTHFENLVELCRCRKITIAKPYANGYSSDPSSTTAESRRPVKAEQFTPELFSLMRRASLCHHYPEPIDAPNRRC